MMSDDKQAMFSEVVRAQEPHLNPVHKVYFRAGLLACRERMARFVEIDNPPLAAGIRTLWWPELGPDPGPPRQIEWGELTEGEYDTPSFRIKTAEEVSPTLEALPIALAFLLGGKPAEPPKADDQ